MFNKDFYDKLPSMVCELLDRWIEKYSEEEIFETAWNEYRSYVMKTRTDLIRMPGYIFKKYYDSKTKTWSLPNGSMHLRHSDGSTILVHWGVPGMRWGVRKTVEDDESSNKKHMSEEQKNTLKTIGVATAGVAIGALAVGTAWYLKNARSKRILQEAKQAAIAKGIATKAARKAAGVYQVFKNVNVMVNGADFVKTFSNVKIAKLLL